MTTPEPSRVHGRLSRFRRFFARVAKNRENGWKRSETEALQRGAEAGARLLGLGAALALLLDHLFRRARDEVRVAELGVDLGDLVRQLLDLLLEPRGLGLEVDHLADRQGIGRL